MRKIYDFLLSLFRRKECVPEDYRVAIENLADRGKNQRFLNDSNEHAVLVVGTMISFLDESDEVLIYSKALEPAFYEKVLRDSKCRIRIILDDMEGTNVIKALPQDIQNRLEFRVTTAGKNGYFIVARDAFRLEVTKMHKRRPYELYVVCNFNEPKAAHWLRERFDTFWESPSRYAKAA